MSEKNKRVHDKFVDMGHFEAIRVQTRVQSGNIIKGDRVVSNGVRSLELHDGADDHPSVVVHREGNQVDRVEFVCNCGRSTTVKLVYDGE